MSTYKERKTQFVSDLVGGSTLDIYLVTSISAISYLIWCVLKRRTNVFSEGIVGKLVDFQLSWNNLLFSTTIYSNNIPLLVVLNILPLVPVFASSSVTSLTTKTARKITVNLRNMTVKQLLPFKTFVTVYRAQMMVITCICIMAVDFPVFPRRFAKVETWGTSLMDLGVGSFVFSMGLINVRSYIRQIFEGRFSYFRNLTATVKGCVPILILGCIRLISVKSVDYHEHVTEYGRHWNFFFTLGFLPILNALLAPIIVKLSPVLTSILVSIVYEYILLHGGLEYIVASSRDDLFSANREGIFSLLGYFAIFLNGFALGAAILPVVPLPNSFFRVGIKREDLIKKYSGGFKGRSFLGTLFYAAVFFQLGYFIIDTCYSYSVSRRMANMLYVIWVSAYNCSFLFIYGLIERFVMGGMETTVISDEGSDVETVIDDLISQEYIPASLDAVNRNSLVLFLVSNLVTGLINLTINTIDCGAFESTGILLAYEILLAGFTMFLYHHKIFIR